MKRKLLLASLGLMAIGFAAVSSTLYMNNTARITKNSNDFKVYYSDAYVNGEQDKSVIVDSTHISFATTMNTIGQKYVLDYEVTNGSKNYDSDLVMNCTGSNTYLSVTNEFDTETTLLAQNKRTGKLTVEMIKSNAGDNFEVDITCTIGANAVGRDTLAEEAPVETFEREYENGTQIVMQGEIFYVIDETDENVTLLSRYGMGTNDDLEVAQAQSADGYDIAYDITWGASENIDTDNIDGEVYDVLRDYETRLTNTEGVNVKASLITLEQLENLGCTNYDCSNSEYTWIEINEDWWTRTSSEDDESRIYMVNSENNIVTTRYTQALAVRPVITIQKDEFREFYNNNADYLTAQLFCETSDYMVLYGRLNDGSVVPNEKGWSVVEGNFEDSYYICLRYSYNSDQDIWGFDKDFNNVYVNTGDGM